MNRAVRERFAFDGIGTAWSIESDRPLGPALEARVLREVEEYDRIWSRFRPDSLVTRLAASGGAADFGDTAPPLLGLLTELCRRTGGAVTPLIGGSLEHLGYGADYRLVPREGHLAAPPADALTVRGTTVTLDRPATIDVGAAGKGQLVDLVTAVLADAGHTSVLVDGGRDLRAAGAPVRVALEHPFDATAAIGVLELRDGALCASAVNRRSWHGLAGPNAGRLLHHVLDGRTGAPVTETAATWVLAADAMTADALATALFFVEPAALQDAYDFGYVRMRSNGLADHSRDLPGELFR